jgi:hypothetical protein
LKATYYANKLISFSYMCIKISMTVEAWNTRMHHSFNFMRKFKLRLPNHMLYEYGSFCQRIKNVCFFITSRSYNVAFLKRYRFSIFNFLIKLDRNIGPEVIRLLIFSAEENQRYKYPKYSDTYLDTNKVSCISYLDKTVSHYLVSGSLLQMTSICMEKTCSSFSDTIEHLKVQLVLIRITG